MFHNVWDIYCFRDEEPRQQNGADEYITRTEEYLFASIFQNYSNRVRPCGPATGKELKGSQFYCLLDLLTFPEVLITYGL